MKINYIEDIIIIDDLFDNEEIKYLENWAQNLKSYRLTDDITHRIVTFSTFLDDTDPVIKSVLEKFKNTFSFKIPNFNRVIINLFRQTDFCDTHKDADYDYGISFLIYLNSHWEMCWGGDTYFSKVEDPDFTIAIRPKPGRLVISPTYMYHGSRPPTVLMRATARLTMVFQYDGYEGDVDINEILNCFMENTDVEI